MRTFKPRAGRTPVCLWGASFVEGSSGFCGAVFRVVDVAFITRRIEGLEDRLGQGESLLQAGDQARVRDEGASEGDEVAEALVDLGLRAGFVIAAGEDEGPSEAVVEVLLEALRQRWGPEAAVGTPLTPTTRAPSVRNAVAST